MTLTPSAVASTSGRFDLLTLQPLRLLHPCLRPLLVSAPCVPRLFRLLPVSLVLLCPRARILPMICFPLPVL